MAIQDTEELEEGLSARERARRKREAAASAKPKPKATPRRTRKASPPNRVDPGFIHNKLATMILKMAQAKAQEVGLPLNVGDLPVPVAEGGTGEIEDGREPVELLARVIAHLAHRIPGLKKVEKRFEGTDAKSGLGSDVFALIAQLIGRNQDVALKVAEGTVKEALKKKPAAPADTPAPAFWPGDQQ